MKHRWTFFNSLLMSVVLTGFVGVQTVPALAFWNPLRWFHHGSSTPVQTPVQTDFPPPSKTAITRECDPLRELIITKNQTTGFQHLIRRPGIGILKKQYFKCIHRVETQEFDYLKHTDLQVRPVDDAFKGTPSKK